jgi:hypothetical protein
LANATAEYASPKAYQPPDGLTRGSHAGDLATELAALKSGFDGKMMLHSGARFVQALSNPGLVDE